MYIKENRTDIWFSNGSKLCMYQCPVYDTSYEAYIFFDTYSDVISFLSNLAVHTIFSPVAFTHSAGYWKKEIIMPSQYFVMPISFDLRINFMDGYFIIIHIPEITTPDKFDEIAALFKTLRYFDFQGNEKIVKDVYYAQFI